MKLFMSNDLKPLMLFLIYIVLTPSYAVAQATNISNGLSYLQSTQSTAGYWGPAAEIPYNTLVNTCTVVDSISKVSPMSTFLGIAVQWLIGQPVVNQDYLALLVSCIKHGGQDVSGLVTSLSAGRNTDGGWGASMGFGSEIKRTAMSMQALATAGSTDVVAISGAVSYLLAAQNADGGWSFVAGDGSRVYYTALVMKALETQTQTTTIANAFSKATAYLLSQQLSDGSWSNVADTALAFMAIVTQTGDITPRIAALNWLLSQQLPDGSWNDDPYSTALALQALAIGAPLQTPPATLVSSVNLVNGSQSATTFGPQQTVTINVGLSGPPAQLEITVLDSNGQTIYTETGSGPFTFDTGTFPPGTYTVLIWVLDPTTGVPVS